MQLISEMFLKFLQKPLSVHVRLFLNLYCVILKELHIHHFISGNIYLKCLVSNRSYPLRLYSTEAGTNRPNSYMQFAHALGNKYIHSFKFHWIVFQSIQSIIQVMGPNKHHSITWTNDDPVQWHMYPLSHLNESMPCILDYRVVVVIKWFKRLLFQNTSHELHHLCMNHYHTASPLVEIISIQSVIWIYNNT